MAQHRWDTSSPGRGGRRPDREHAPARRWALSFPAAVLAACLLIGCSAAVFLLRDRSPVPVASIDLATTGPAPVEPVPPSPKADAATGGTDAGAAGNLPADAREPDGTVVVHVAGAVQRPGVVRLAAGSRIADAVDAAGGTDAEADLAAVNLAAVLEDGAMVLVPRLGEAGPPPAGAVTGIPGADGPTVTGGGGVAPGMPGPSGPGAAVNLNTADSALLQTLPRVGPVLAERIIAWRSEHGRFGRPQDLDAVPGIGEAMLAALLPLVTV